MVDFQPHIICFRFVPPAYRYLTSPSPRLLDIRRNSYNHFSGYARHLRTFAFASFPLLSVYLLIKLENCQAVTA